MKELTERQTLVFEFIKGSIAKTGFPPTVREIGDQFGITVKGAYDHLKAIEKKNYIKCTNNKSRAIEIVGGNDRLLPENMINIPLVGSIAAGEPLLAEQNIDEYLPFPKSNFSSGTFFALRVQGDSMIEAGILDGDVALIKQQPDADDGSIVAALVEGSATLKVLKKLKSSIKLLPKNSKYEPIVGEDISLLGVLTGLFREY